VFVGIILLLNLLIALMSETYEFMREQATVEYRWLLAHPFKTGFVFLWPSPFCIFHLILLLLITPAFLVSFCVGNTRWLLVDYQLYNKLKEDVPKGLKKNCQRLFKGMVVQYFKEALKDDKEEFERCLVFDHQSLIGVEEKE